MTILLVAIGQKAISLRTHPSLISKQAYCRTLTLIRDNLIMTGRAPGMRGALGLLFSTPALSHRKSPMRFLNEIHAHNALAARRHDTCNSGEILSLIHLPHSHHAQSLSCGQL